MKDEDDWVGTPPEGHHAPGTSDPEFWRSRYRSHWIVAGTGMTIVVVLLVVVIIVG